MAELSSEDRAELWADFQRELSAERDLIAVTKADLRAAVDALDVFLNNNAAAINTAIPQPARSQLTVPQKARLLMFVIRQRYLKGA